MGRLLRILSLLGVVAVALAAVSTCLERKKQQDADFDRYLNCEVA